MITHSSPLITETEVPFLEKYILIIEDEAVFAGAVRKRLKRGGYNAEVAGTLAEGVRKISEKTPDLLLLDMRLPDGSGLDLLGTLQNSDDNAYPVLVMSAYGEIEDAVSAMKSGASDYLKKPIDLDELMITVEKVLEKDELSQKLTYSSKREQHAHEGVKFLGDSAAIVAIRQQIDRLKQVKIVSAPPTILILGETGTGKDVVARQVHANSARRERPFVHVDCASLPKDLIEAELFGHEKGAFTSAHVARTGLIEAAEDGVLFMDEIGELPMDLQAKLLAVLERRTLRKVGTTKERPVAAWIIAATNRDVAQLVERGEFRSDLYYRLNVLSITIAPLRERGDDIILLARHFIRQSAKRYGIRSVTLSGQAIQALRSYHWPGNVRELKHMIERAILLCGEGELTPDDLSLAAHVQPGTGTGLNLPPGIEADLTLDNAELLLIQNALEKCNGNVSKAARELGITRMALRYRIKKHNLE